MKMLTRAATAAVTMAAGLTFGAGPASATDCEPNCANPDTVEPVRQLNPYITIGVLRQSCGTMMSHSVDSTPVRLTVANRTRTPFVLYWHNTSGSRESARTLQPPATVNITTYRGHAWEVASTTGTCLSQFVISDDSTRSYVTYG
ncbi:hypothetical protein [Actinoplanes sp. HUAS TT8]|uniref:hypothetical protein n=1 Tax=Actinoplanes sp. HUAS TT8 TaxID=3447453 RepID=UPI003F521AF0